MKKASRCGDCGRWVWLVFALVAPRHLPAAQADPAPIPEAPALPATNATLEADQQLRAYLKLQEQLHGTLLAIEQARLQSAQESRAQAEALAARFDLLEKSLDNQREQRLQTMQDSNRTMLMLAGSIVGLGLLALAFSAMFHSRGMNRLTELANGFASDRALLAGGVGGELGGGEKLLPSAGFANRASQPLLATIRRLEQRVEELEQSASRALPLGDSNPPNGEPAFSGGRAAGPDGRLVDHLSALLGKGQVLVSLGQPEAALACYDQALVEAPDRADAHLKKGLALERLKRFGDAIACYDRAIELDPLLTQAYLCRGAVLNQQERYTEALESYEQALRSQATSRDRTG